MILLLLTVVIVAPSLPQAGGNPQTQTGDFRQNKSQTILWPKSKKYFSEEAKRFFENEKLDFSGDYYADSNEDGNVMTDSLEN